MKENAKNTLIDYQMAKEILANKAIAKEAVRDERSGEIRTGRRSGRRARYNRRVMISFTLMAAAVFMVLVLMAVLLGGTSKVHAGENKDVSYQSIEIAEGESLWSVAESYKGVGEKTSSFVKKVAALNGICADAKLSAGSYLLVPVS
jgi:hypothetical protein